MLDWGPARWMDDILHRLAVEMVKTATIISLPELCWRPATHSMNDARRAVPCDAMRCFASSHAVRESRP